MGDSPFGPSASQWTPVPDERSMNAVFWPLMAAKNSVLKARRALVYGPSQPLLSLRSRARRYQASLSMLSGVMSALSAQAGA